MQPLELFVRPVYWDIEEECDGGGKYDDDEHSASPSSDDHSNSDNDGKDDNDRRRSRTQQQRRPRGTARKIGSSKGIGGTWMPLPVTLGRKNLVSLWWRECPRCQNNNGDSRMQKYEPTNPAATPATTKKRKRPCEYCDPILEECCYRGRDGTTPAATTGTKRRKTETKATSSGASSISRRVVEYDVRGTPRVVARHRELVRFVSPTRDDKELENGNGGDAVLPRTSRLRIGTPSSSSSSDENDEDDSLDDLSTSSSSSSSSSSGGNFEGWLRYRNKREARKKNKNKKKKWRMEFDVQVVPAAVRCSSSSPLQLPSSEDTSRRRSRCGSSNRTGDVATAANASSSVVPSSSSATTKSSRATLSRYGRRLEEQRRRAIVTTPEWMSARNNGRGCDNSSDGIHVRKSRRFMRYEEDGSSSDDDGGGGGGNENGDTCGDQPRLHDTRPPDSMTVVTPRTVESVLGKRQDNAVTSAAAVAAEPAPRPTPTQPAAQSVSEAVSLPQTPSRRTTDATRESSSRHLSEAAEYANGSNASGSDKARAALSTPVRTRLDFSHRFDRNRKVQEPMRIKEVAAPTTSTPTADEEIGRVINNCFESRRRRGLNEDTSGDVDKTNEAGSSGSSGIEKGSTTSLQSQEPLVHYSPLAAAAAPASANEADRRGTADSRDGRTTSTSNNKDNMQTQFLSLEVEDSSQESSSSPHLSMREATQPVVGTDQRQQQQQQRPPRYEAMSLRDWKDRQRDAPSGSFRRAMIDLIIAKKEAGDPDWLPPLLLLSNDGVEDSEEDLTAFV